MAGVQLLAQRVKIDKGNILFKTWLGHVAPSWQGRRSSNWKGSDGRALYVQQACRLYAKGT